MAVHAWQLPVEQATVKFTVCSPEYGLQLALAFRLYAAQLAGCVQMHCLLCGVHPLASHCIVQHVWV
jgi:hypothetical protein